MAFTTITEAIGYLDSFVGKTTYPTRSVLLQRITTLLDLLGNPHLAYPTVHVGGTSGKTSTATMIATILQTAGYKTGLHISPHLEDLRERMQDNGKIMIDDQFVDMVNHMVPIIDKASAGKFGPPSYFEILLAMSFQYFKDQKVDIAVIEVGLGGTLDGTNVITPLVSILTNVGLDHTEILGDTIEKIAQDKVGIFKPGIPVVTGVTQPSVIEIVTKKAQETGSEVYLLNRDFVGQVNASQQVLDFSFDDQTQQFHLQNLDTYQSKNASLAIMATKLVGQQGFSINQNDQETALKDLIVPGRFEIIAKDPTIILDGAHNPDKIAALVASLENHFPNKKIRFIFGVKNDKDKQSMLNKLSPLAEKFYFTQFYQHTDLGTSVAVDPQGLPALTSVSSEVHKNAKDAIAQARDEAQKDDVICLTGSLYLVGEMRPYIRSLGN